MPELSFQLYSARNTALPDALKIVADAGYRQVEAYVDNFSNPELFRDYLNANKLTVCSVHVDINVLKTKTDESLALIDSFNIEHIVCPYLLPEQRPKNKAGWIDLAEQLLKINDVLSKHGKTFAWHNHDFEFQALSDGSMPMQVLLEHAPNMHWELDIGWIHRAGDSPQKWMQQYSERVSAIHLKDVAAQGECLDEDGWADVGHGVIDWQALVGDIKNTEAKVLAVEHDNPSNLQRFAQNSYSSIHGWAW